MAKSQSSSHVISSYKLLKGSPNELPSSPKRTLLQGKLLHYWGQVGCAGTGMLAPTTLRPRLRPLPRPALPQPGCGDINLFIKSFATQKVKKLCPFLTTAQNMCEDCHLSKFLAGDWWNNFIHGASEQGNPMPPPPNSVSISICGMGAYGHVYVGTKNNNVFCILLKWKDVFKFAKMEGCYAKDNTVEREDIQDTIMYILPEKVCVCYVCRRKIRKIDFKRLSQYRDFNEM